MDLGVGDMDAAALLAAASDGVRARRMSEVHEMLVVAQWAVLHGEDPLEGPEAGFARVTGNRLVQLGGDGTPGVQDHCLGEIALARSTSDVVTSNLMADVLDLQHRLPKTWARCLDGTAEPYVARKVARMCRHLPLDKVGVVDTAVARVIHRYSAGRVFTVAEGKVVEADPELHTERSEAERKKRYATMGRRDEYGLRTFIARLEAGDAMWLDATITRVVELITDRHPDAGRDELRAIALGMLARPAEVFALLCEHTVDDTQGEEQGELDLDLDDSGDSDDRGADGEEVSIRSSLATRPPNGELDSDDSAGRVAGEEVSIRSSLATRPPTGPSRPHPLAGNRALAFPADLLDALRDLDVSPLAPKAVVYVHLHEAALTGTTDGVARVEGLGPVTLEALQGLLARTNVVVKPVLDLSDRVVGTAYEFPESVKERVHLATGGDYWPWATSTSRRVDYDHVRPYRPPGEGGPPGQTSTENCGPLSRRHHRWKTHAGYRARQCGKNRYVWLTPHGLAFLTDHHGTRAIPHAQAEAIHDAPDGVDLYFGWSGGV